MTQVLARRRSRRGAERGQVLLVFALMATVLVGFCGLALDAAVSHFDQRQLQETADSAALAAAYRVYSGDTETAASAVATAVASDDGCTSSVNCTLTLVYEDSTFAVTASASSATYVVANLSEPHTNQFIQVLNKSAQNTIRVSATAQVYNTTTTGATNLACGLCLLDTGNDVLVGTHAGVTISVAQGDLDVNGQVKLSGQPSSILVTNGKFNVASTNNTFGNWTINPAAITGTNPIADPLGTVPPPSTSGLTVQSPSNFTANNTTINPGIYGTLKPSGTVTFNPGTYVFVGGGIVNSSANTALTGTGVTLYFTCGTYPTPAPCATGGQAGAQINASQSIAMNISAPSSGLLTNLLIYYDRNNTSGITFNQNVSGSNVGAVYAAKAKITITNSGTFTLGSPIVAYALNITCCGLTFGSTAGVGSGTVTKSPGNLYR